MKFLVDESTGIKVARELSQSHDVKYVGDTDLGALDSAILEIASKEKRIVITNDKDFGELIVRRKLSHSGVILLRLTIDSPLNRLKTIKALILRFGNELEDHFVIATEHKVRIRKA